MLTAYQDAAYAERYRAHDRRVAAADERVAGQAGLTDAAARSLFKLMAYKDEYEVARLHADPAFMAKLKREFDGDLQLQFHLAPPLFARRDPTTGLPRKRAYGGWMMPVFRTLAKFKSLRGTALDPFGRTRERQAERQAIADFERTLERLSAGLDADQLRAGGRDRRAAADGSRLRARQGSQPRRVREEAGGADGAVRARGANGTSRRLRFARRQVGALMNVPQLKALCRRYPGAAETLHGAPYNFLVYAVAAGSSRTSRPASLSGGASACACRRIASSS